MDFIQHEDIFLLDVIAVYESFFYDKEKIIKKYLELGSQDTKNQFLRIVNKYNFLVKSIKLSHNNFSCTDTQAASDTYKFVTIIALIESLYPEEKYTIFYDWLMKIDCFPITKKEATDKFNEYNKIFGSRKCIVEFFSSLDDETKYYIQKSMNKIKDSNNKKNEDHDSIECLSRTLYQIRSDYIHKAELVTEFSGVLTGSVRDNDGYCFEFPISNFCTIFELGLLRFFNIEPDRKPELVNEKY